MSDLNGTSYRSNEENSSNILNGLYKRGDISVSADFPTPVEAKVRFVWEILVIVTDNDVTKTNTGDSFGVGDMIMWNGNGWKLLGNTQEVPVHAPQHEILGDDIVDIDGGSF
jgi:hypothetical protein